MRAQSVHIKFVIRFKHHCTGQFLAESLVGKAKDGTFVDRWQFINCCLNFSAEDILASADHHILGAIEDKHEALLKRIVHRSLQAVAFPEAFRGPPGPPGAA